MIITRLAGGLGNQMFQYAIARTYQRNDSEKIILDTRLLQKLEKDINKIVQRPFALDIFINLQAEKMDSAILNSLQGQDIVSKLKRKILGLYPTYIVQQLMEPVPFSSINTKNIYLEGNFQSELYFKSVRKKLIKDYTFPQLDSVNQKIKEKILNTSNAISLHIRRGDYHSTSNKNIFTSVNLEYYYNAIAILRKELNLEYFDTFVFTDDINWVKKNFKPEKLNINFVEGNFADNSWKDMYLMSCCEHHIIANSSFSWWGAWLSQKEGINLAPKYWFRPNTYSFDINNIIPETWSIIDYNLS